jgi:hypothetical protein
MGKAKDRQAKGRPVIVGVMERRIRNRQREYEEQHNPLAAWEAYYVARVHREWGIDVPEWVLGYLDRVALALLLDMQDEPAGEALSARLATALEFRRRGRGSVFARRRAARAAVDIALEVIALLPEGNGKLEWAAGEVAKRRGVHRSTVERAYRAFKARRNTSPS